MEMGCQTDMMTTEQKNPRTGAIALNDTPALLQLMNEEDRLVPLAIEPELPRIAAVVDLAVQALEKQGRILYVGAGTSGRLGVLDASECPPTFGVPPTFVQGFIAGGDIALRNAVEGAEDDPEAGAALMDAQGVGPHDLVIGISASGSARYVIGAVTRAKALGAATAAIVNNGRRGCAKRGCLHCAHRRAGGDCRLDAHESRHGAKTCAEYDLNGHDGAPWLCKRRRDDEPCGYQ